MFEIPIFPLNVVLFPGMPLPLHIFEPRYKLMIHRLLSDDHRYTLARTFGVALLIEGDEGDNDAFPASAGCTTEILEHSFLADGRINLQTEGRRRFRILSMNREDDYFVANVEWLDDDWEPRDPLYDLAAQVSRALRRYLQMIAPNAERALDDMEMPRDPEDFSHWVAMLMAASNGQKQRLLEATSTSLRLRAELRLLQRAQIVQQSFVRRSIIRPDDESLPGEEFLLFN